MGKRFRRKDGILFGFQMFLWGLYVNFVFSFVLFNKTKKIISFENPGKKRDDTNKQRSSDVLLLFHFIFVLYLKTCNGCNGSNDGSSKANGS